MVSLQSRVRTKKGGEEEEEEGDRRVEIMIRNPLIELAESESFSWVLYKAPPPSIATTT